MQNVYSNFRFETKIDFQGLTIEINGSAAGVSSFGGFTVCHVLQLSLPILKP